MREVGPVETGEVKTVWFDFSTEKSESELLSTPTVTVTVMSGTDASPELVKTGLATVNGDFVTQKVRPGVAGCKYRLTALVNGSDGNVHRVDAYLRVVP